MPYTEVVTAQPISEVGKPGEREHENGKPDDDREPVLADARKRSGRGLDQGLR